MGKRLVRPRHPKVAAVIGVTAALLAVALVPAAHAGKPGTTTIYEALLGNDPDPLTPGAGLYGDGADGAMTSYGPTASSSSFSLDFASGRSFLVTLNHAGTLLTSDFQCRSGMLFGGDNPLVICYSDAAQQNGYFIDFPPFGNDNKRNRAANPPCARFEKKTTGTVTTVPATCLAQVTVSEGGETAGTYTGVSMPFRFETRAP